MRLELFQRVAAEHELDAVLLAHHADDQAETILHRLLRGSGISGLGGIAAESRQGNLLQGGSNGAAATTPSPALPRSTGRGGKSGPLLIRRPLLGVPGRLLREYLQAAGQGWREDASNQSGRYMRNRLRRVLADEPGLADALREVGRSCEALRRWVQSAAPVLPDAFDVALLCDLPPLLAHEAARRWLVARGVPPEELLPAVAQRLIDMATDAAAPPRQHFPGRVLVRRSHGRIEAV
jgi:tRNA(Ile)-lysidine synthase